MDDNTSPTGWQQPQTRRKQRRRNQTSPIPVSTDPITKEDGEECINTCSYLPYFCPNRQPLQYHPLYSYAIELDLQESPKHSYTDVEKWAIADWEEFEIWIENQVDFRRFYSYKDQWFIDLYGDIFRPHNVLNYDFERYQQDVIQYFLLAST